MTLREDEAVLGINDLAVVPPGVFSFNGGGLDLVWNGFLGDLRAADGTIPVGLQRQTDTCITSTVLARQSAEVELILHINEALGFTYFTGCDFISRHKEHVKTCAAARLRMSRIL
jgi:hypothetical protein